MMNPSVKQKVKEEQNRTKDLFGEDPFKNF